MQTLFVCYTEAERTPVLRNPAVILLLHDSDKAENCHVMTSTAAVRY